jgi:hypothetical protein
MIFFGSYVICILQINMNTQHVETSRYVMCSKLVFILPMLTQTIFFLFILPGSIRYNIIPIIPRMHVYNLSTSRKLHEIIRRSFKNCFFFFF